MGMRWNFKFFSTIRTQFGINTCNFLKEFIKLTEQGIMLRIRIRFLNSCIGLKLIPQHLDMYNRYENCCFFQDSSKIRLKKLFYNHVKTVLRLELDDAYRQLIVVRNRIYKAYNKIMKVLPWFISKRFFGHQEKNNRIKWITEITRINRKIEWLIARNNKKIKKEIKPINYFCNDNNRNELKISLKKDTDQLTEIKISPDNFKLSSPLNELHDNWFVNLSKKTIPDEVRLLLQLGERFSLPFMKKDSEKTTIEFIKCIEKNLFKEVEIIGNNIRNQSIPIIKRLFRNMNNNNQNEKLLLRCLQHTRRFTKDNPDILFTKADKGNATVAMDVNDYKNRMIENFF